MRRLLESRTTVVVTRILLGALFMYAAISKIAEPPDFAKEIFAYRIVPAPLVNLMAIYLPWLELAIGMALVAGVAVTGASAAAGALLVVFISAILIRFARGETDFECGCFRHEAGAAALPVVGPILEFLLYSSNARVTLARDFVFLAMAAVVQWSPLRGFFGTRPERGDNR